MKRFSACMVFWLIAFAIVPLFASCSGQSSADAPSPPVRIAISDPNVFEIDRPEQFPLTSVETCDVAGQLTVNGVVAPDIALTVHVTSLSGGRVVDIRARLGDEVRKGQVLVVIRSQDLAQAISDYQKNVADELLARKALERARLLYEHGAVPQKDVEAAQDAEDKAKVDVAAGADRIRLLGGDIDRQSPVIEIASPISGVIVEQNTAGGEGIKSLDNTPSLFTVADLSRIWVMFDVYENDISQVRLGDVVDVSLKAYPEKTFKGRISNLSPILDPATRTAKVRVELANSGGIFRPGMFATAHLISQANQKRMCLPTTALLRLHDKNWVFVREEGTRFRRVEVQEGASLPNGKSIVLSGLQPGERVVADALQFSSAAEVNK